MKHAKSLVIGAALAALAPVGCGGDDASGPLGNVDALVILQRPARNDGGDIFQYTSYIPGARLVKLQPPTADGTVTVLCCDKAGPEFANMDIMAYDISFDAKEIVFAGKLAADQNYGLFVLEVDTGAVTQLATDPGRDYVSPTWLPGDKIFFVANDVVENGAPQFQDEYERGTTTQVGTINKDGSALTLGPRNLSHRAHPSLASDGRVIMTEWRHLGQVNEGDLVFMASDMTSVREAFGREGTEASNSTLKAREISPGRYVAVATSRDRTLQSGALVDIRLGFTSENDGTLRADDQMSEAHASYVMLTPQVPTDRSPSANTIGRYYDAFPLDAGDSPNLLVSWADGPVESGVLGAAGISANFGVYLYDTKNQQRRPILDDPNMWDVFARPLQARSAPPISGSVIDANLNGQTLIGALNVYDSTLHTFDPGSVFGVRIMEGFSSEGGGPRMFGTTMFEGHANIGIAPVQADGSWLATVPANVPIHLQTIDKFGMSLFNEPVWFSGRAGESRVCGGCHEDRASTAVINPGITLAAAVGPTAAMGTVARNARMSTDAELANANLINPAGDRNATLASASRLIGMGWSKAIQPVFSDNNRCISCHDGTANGMNPSYQIMDPATGQVVFSYTFDLTDKPVMIPGEPGEGPQTYPASYIALAGVDMEAVERGNLMIVGDYRPAGKPMDSRGSSAITHVDPFQIFPTVNTGIRAFGTGPHATYPELSATEMLKLITVIDNGLNFYSRETAPGGMTD